jgi:hypothetical protein
MVRQAHTYLAGAVSGTALIAAAVVAFVLLVSLQALRDWPLAGIAGGGDDSAVSNARPAAGGGPNTAVGAGAPAAASRSANASGNRQLPGNRAGDDRQQVGGATFEATPPSPAPGSPGGNAPAPTPAGGGGAANPPTQPAPSNSGGGGGGNGGPVSLPGTGGAVGGGSGQSTSGAVSGAVNDTVSGVDQTLGGALGDTGVTKVTEEVVSGAAGPESTGGETVDKVVETVNGLLGGKR